MNRGVFLCHASEDKSAVVRPLASSLEAAGISCWLDEAEIMWGDSLISKVNEGLRTSRYTLVILSEAFLEKNWPKMELESALNLEASSGDVRVLPLLVGSKGAIDRILQAYPLLNHKKYMLWSNGPESVIQELKKRLGQSSTLPATAQTSSTQPIPMPRIRKTFSDLERLRFLKSAYGTIKEYFRTALSQLEQHDARINTDFTEVNNLKFAASIFVDGDARKQCVINYGTSSFGGYQITYREGTHIDIQNDNSMNDWVAVETDEHEMYLTPSGMNSQSTESRLSPEKAAGYFWLRFIQHI